jgi:hypothetical protein
MTSPTLEGRRADLPAIPPRIHPTAAAVFEALERAGVRWCLVRGEGRLEAPPHDVDLLVAAADLDAMSRAVQRLGFIPVPTWARGSHRFFVAYLPSFDDWFVLDVITELAYGPGYAMRTGAAEGCLARRERVGSLALMSADDAFWTLLLHCMLDRGDFPPHQVERLRRLSQAGHLDSALARFAAAACPSGWGAARILAAVATDDWAALIRLGPRMIARWRRRHPVRFWRRSLADRVAWRIAPLHTLLALRGLRTAVISEEPQVARSVAAGLRESFYFPVVLDARRRAAGPRRPASSARSIIRRLAEMGRSVVAGYHQSRGRLVVVPLGSGGDTDSDGGPAAVTAAGRPRPHVVVQLRRGAPAGVAPATGACGNGSQAGAGALPRRVVVGAEGDLAQAGREVMDAIWQAYGECRGWRAA